MSFVDNLEKRPRASEIVNVVRDNERTMREVLEAGVATQTQLDFLSKCPRQEELFRQVMEACRQGKGANKAQELAKELSIPQKLDLMNRIARDLGDKIRI